MEIKILKPGDEEKLEEFLLPRMNESMFLLSNMREAGLTDSGKPFEGTYAAEFDSAGDITGVVAHFWNGILMFQNPCFNPEIWKMAAAYSEREIKGMIGPDVQVLTARDSLNLPEEHFQSDKMEKLYSLLLADLKVPELLSEGAVKARRITSADIELLTQWQTEFDIESLDAQDTPQLKEENRKRVQRSLSRNDTWILEKDAVPVATSGFNAMLKEAVQLGGVWTPPELRGNGYCRSVVAASLIDAREKGVRTGILFTSEDNIPAQKAYSSVGFREVGTYRITLLKVPVPWKGSECL